MIMLSCCQDWLAGAVAEVMEVLRCASSWMVSVMRGMVVHSRRHMVVEGSVAGLLCVHERVANELRGARL